jgi:HEAT repeat protein
MGLTGRRCRRRAAGAAPALVLLLLILAPVAAPAQPRAVDPVERLRLVLKTIPYDAAARDQSIRACLPELRTLGDLSRAVTLLEWRDGGDDALAAVDRAHRAALTEQFTAAVRAALQRQEATTTQVTAELLVEMARTARTRGDGLSLAAAFVPDLARLASQGKPAVRVVAVKALGKIDAEPAAVVAVLAERVGDSQLPVRRAAGEALTNVLQGVSESLSAAGSSAQVVVGRREAIGAAFGAARGAMAGVDDPYAEVRGVALRTAAAAAGVLGKLLSDPPGDDAETAHEREEAWKRLRAEGEEVRSLVEALGQTAAAVAPRLRDPDPEARLLAHQALEAMGRARVRWLRQRDANTPDDPLGEGLVTALLELTGSLTDRDARFRRAALDVLEPLGPLAAPAVSSLARALADPDRFVRWAAVRTLGGIGPAARTALPDLTRLLQDPDLDIRLAAAAALERLDPHGRGLPVRTTQWAVASPQAGPPPSGASLPGLIRTLQGGDAELRVAALHAVRGMGSDALPALAALAEALRDPDARVRQAAAETIGTLGPAARAAAAALRDALRDASPDVRSAAGAALLAVERR